MNTKWYRFKRTTFTNRHLKRQQIQNNFFLSFIRLLITNLSNLEHRDLFKPRPI